MTSRKSKKESKFPVPKDDVDVYQSYDRIIRRAEGQSIHFSSLRKEIKDRACVAISAYGSWESFASALRFDDMAIEDMRKSSVMHTLRFDNMPQYVIHKYVKRQSKNNEVVSLSEILRVIRECDFFPVINEIRKDLENFVGSMPELNPSNATVTPEENMDLTALNDRNDSVDGTEEDVGRERRSLDTSFDFVDSSRSSYNGNGFNGLSNPDNSYDTMAADSGIGVSLTDGSAVNGRTPTKCSSNKQGVADEVTDEVRHFSLRIDVQKEDDNKAVACMNALISGDRPPDDIDDACMGSMNPAIACPDAHPDIIRMFVVHSSDCIDEAYELKRSVDTCDLSDLSMHVHTIILQDVCDSVFRCICENDYLLTLFNKVDFIVMLTSDEYYRDIQPWDFDENGNRCELSCMVRKLYNESELQCKRYQSQNYRIQPVRLSSINEAKVPKAYKNSVLTLPYNFDTLVENPRKFIKFMHKRKQVALRKVPNLFSR